MDLLKSISGRSGAFFKKMLEQEKYFWLYNTFDLLKTSIES